MSRAGAAVLATAAAVVLAVAAVLVVTTPATAGAPRDATVTIVNNAYQPDATEVDPGGTVTWTNVDPTAHTVTADDGSFDSGRLRPGQRFQLTFNRPGTYLYYCEPHDFMVAAVFVVGADEGQTTTPTPGPPPPPGGTTPTTEPAVPGTSPPATTTPAAPPVVDPAADAGAVPAPEAGEVAGDSAADAPTAAATEPVAPAAVVTGGRVSGGRRELPATAVIVAVLALVLAATATATRRMAAAVAARGAAVALTALAGALHVWLLVVVGYPQPVGTLFFAHGCAALVVAVHVWGGGRTAIIAAAAFHGASLGAFAASRWWSLFGYRELGWDPAPYSALAVGASLAAAALLAAMITAGSAGGGGRPAAIAA